MEQKGALKLVDDVSLLLQDLRREKDPETIKRRLVEIVIYIRTEHDFRGDLKGERTESIAGLEQNVIGFLDSYHANNFEEIYSIIREIIRLTPKFFVFGIDIAELREPTISTTRTPTRGGGGGGGGVYFFIFLFYYSNFCFISLRGGGGGGGGGGGYHDAFKSIGGEYTELELE
jgi:hypothetical protein